MKHGTYCPIILEALSVESKLHAGNLRSQCEVLRLRATMDSQNERMVIMSASRCKQKEVGN